MKAKLYNRITTACLIIVVLCAFISSFYTYPYEWIVGVVAILAALASAFTYLYNQPKR